MRRAVPLLILAAACGPDGPRERYEALERERFSVVLFLVDTLRADHLGCYGYERDTSPRLDAFASEGVLFANCLAQSTWTKPSTASIHTGLYPSRHGANQVFSVLDDSLGTLAELLSGRGYRTAGFGFNVYVFGEETGFEQGFDTFVPVVQAKRAYPRGGRIVDAALEWLEQAGDEPFFLYLHLFDPHMPYGPPEPYDERFDRGYAGELAGDFSMAPELTPDALSAEDWRHLEDLYDGEVAYVDAQFGRLLDGLERHGLANDTLVIFLSDHGEELFDHGGWSHTPTMFQELLHVPLVCRFPNLPDELRGATVADLAQQVDVLPTVADLVGADVDERLPGRSLLAKALGALPATRAGISEADDLGVYRKALVMDGHKYVRTWVPADGEALYDLARDPGERDELGAGTARLAPYRAVLDRHVLESGGRYSLVFQNNGEAMVRVTGFVTTEVAPVSGSELVDFERKGSVEDWDGPFLLEQHELEGRKLYATRFTLRTAPGDRDGIVFVPNGLEERATIVFTVDGRTPELDRVHIGLDRRPAATARIELDLGNPAAYLAPGPAAAGESDDGPYRVWIWKNLDVASPEAELSPEAMQALKDVGYLGDR